MPPLSEFKAAPKPKPMRANKIVQTNSQAPPPSANDSSTANANSDLQHMVLQSELVYFTTKLQHETEKMQAARRIHEKQMELLDLQLTKTKNKLHKSPAKSAKQPTSPSNDTQ